VLRGKYLTPAFALKIGESAIRNCLRDQLKFLREESRSYMGSHPVVFTEIGIPYDMDDKYAYKSGNYTSQTSAMDANHFALEGSTANGFTLWVYVTQVIPLGPYQQIKLTNNRMTMNGVTSGMEKICLYTPTTIWNCPPETLLGPLIHIPRPTLEARVAEKI
jgi:hypothetical protein